MAATDGPNRPSAAAPPLPTSEFLGQCGISRRAIEQIDEMNPQPVFDLKLAEVVKVGPPLPILFQVFGYMFGQQDVAGITAIHHSLSYINTRAGNIHLIVNVRDLVDRATVHTHANLDVGM